jgi:aspartyl-tRNA(Asn)/glutamyl-tRNA(Gln) amidotransferase subunit C
MSYDIQNIAKLARLKLNPQEFEILSNDFHKIISYVQKLNALDVDKLVATGKITEMTHVHADARGLRGDAITNIMTHAEALQNAPKVSGRAFETPLIIEHSEDENSDEHS